MQNVVIKYKPINSSRESLQFVEVFLDLAGSQHLEFFVFSDHSDFDVCAVHLTLNITKNYLQILPLKSLKLCE
jgi:hypothetical protein